MEFQPQPTFPELLHEKDNQATDQPTNQPIRIVKSGQRSYWSLYC